MEQSTCSVAWDLSTWQSLAQHVANAPCRFLCDTRHVISRGYAKVVAACSDQTERSGHADDDVYAKYAEFLGCAPNQEAVQSMAVMHAGQLLYATCSEAGAAMLPFINKDLGGDVVSYARLQSVTAGVSLVGGLAFGKCADIFGARMALIISHASAAVHCVLMAIAPSQIGLLLITVPALTMHGFQSAQQVAVVNSTPERREIALGLTGVSYGLGFFSGTLVVSYMAGWLPPRELMLAAAAAEVAGVLYIAASYPKGASDSGCRGTEATCSSSSSAQDQSENSGGEGLLDILRKPHVAGLICLKMAVTISGGTVWIMAQQFALDPFGFTAVQTSLLLSYIGGVQLVAQGVIMPFIGMPSAKELYMGGTASVGIPLLALACNSGNAPGFVFWLGPLTAAVYCVNVAISSALSRHVSAESSGSIVALGVAPFSVAFMTSPVIAAAVYKRLGFTMVPLTATAALVGMVFLAMSLDDAICGGASTAEEQEQAHQDVEMRGTAA